MATITDPVDHEADIDIALGTRGGQARALLDFLVIRTVRSKTRAGTVVTLIPGNHDEYLRRFCDLQLGHIMVTAEAVHRTMDGRLFLVVHGDQFDGITRYHRWLAMTGDVGYDMLLVVNRWFNRGHRVRRDGTLELLSVASATTQGVTATRLALT